MSDGRPNVSVAIIVRNAEIDPPPQKPGPEAGRRMTENGTAAESPLVSVILPVHNGETYLRDAVESVRAQRYEPLEIIIVDDGSTDGTAALARNLGENLVYVRQDNAGPSAARNAGLALARGSVVAFIDADDVWPDGKLALQLPRLLADPQLDIVSGRVQRVRLLRREDGSEAFEEFTPLHESPFPYNLGCALYRRAVFARVGGFDETMRYSEDVDWLMRAREADVRIVVLPEVTLVYRLHGANMTHGRDMKGLGFFNALRKSAARRDRSSAQSRPRIEPRRLPLVS